jgi:hypothetical protein
MPKFFPKIPSNGARSSENGDGGSVGGSHVVKDQPLESMVIIRVKRRRDEASKPIIVVSKEEPEHISKRMATPEALMSQLSMGDTRSRAVTKVFKLLGSAISTQHTAHPGEAPAWEESTKPLLQPSGIDGASKLLQRLSEHQLKHRDRTHNVKRNTDRQHSHESALSTRIR